MEECKGIYKLQEGGLLMKQFNPIWMDPKEFQGKRVLVTSGTKGGMGEAIVITTAHRTSGGNRRTGCFSCFRPRLLHSGSGAYH